MRRALYEDAWAVDEDAEAEFFLAASRRAATTFGLALTVAGVAVVAVLVVPWLGSFNLLQRVVESLPANLL